MTFNELINTVVEPYKFKETIPIHADDTLRFIRDILITPNHKVVILGDWDVDGIHSAKIVYNDLYAFGLNEVDIEVYFGDRKTHGLNYDFIRAHLRKEITHVIIVDSSTNNIEELQMLKNMGLRVMVLDHHNPEYSYDTYKNLCVIENAKFPGNDDLFEISAGYLCAILSNYWRKNLGYPKSLDNQIFGYITLHSDGCLLHDQYIKPIAMYPENFRDAFPVEIKPFTTKYTKLNRNFVSFSYCPRINNLCRHNRADLLKAIYFERLTPGQITTVKNAVETLYQDTKKEKDIILDKYLDYTEDLGFFVLADLNKVLNISNFEWSYLSNATGFIAGALSERLKRPVIAYIDSHDGEYKMSGRDATNKVDFRDFLKLYNISGGGHVYAAGFKIPIIDFEDFKQQITGQQDFCETSGFLVWDVSNANPISILKVTQRLSRYNEVAIGKLKPIYLKMHLNSNWVQTQIGKLRKFSFGDILVIKDLLSKTEQGEFVLVEPNISNPKEMRIIYKEERLK